MLNKYERGTAVYGVTQFADLTIDEFNSMATGVKRKLANSSDTRYMREVNLTNNKVLPDNFDWRNHRGVVSEVKSQNVCGSCWAFSVTGNIEGQWGITKGKGISLSEQGLNGFYL